MAKMLRYKGYSPFALLVGGLRVELKPGETVELPAHAADYHLMDSERWEEVRPVVPAVDDEPVNDEPNDSPSSDEDGVASEEDKPARKKGK